jgi:hypothetical protein
LLVLRGAANGRRQASLLVAPASLFANWADEMKRFASGLKALIAHTSAMAAGERSSWRCWGVSCALRSVMFRVGVMSSSTGAPPAPG